MKIRASWQGFVLLASLSLASSWACSSGASQTVDGGLAGMAATGGRGGGGGTAPPLPAPACAPAPTGGVAMVKTPVLKHGLVGGEEGWLGSPAVADLEGDGRREIVAARDGTVFVWNDDGSSRGQVTVCGGRIWAAPVVADLVGDDKLEIAVACRDKLAVYSAGLAVAPGFPVSWRDEMRSLAAGDLDGDGALELVVGTTSDLKAGGRTDIFHVFRGDGRPQPGFPANTSGTSGCDDACYVHAGFDQNVALGPIDGSGGDDVFLPQDNAYVSIHQGSGVAFDANPMFRKRTKVLGVRFLHDYAEAQQGYADDEDSALQAHFTNSPGAIADIDGDGKNELVFVGSVQNAAQSNREQGVALWVIHPDGSRPAAFTTPLHVRDYLAGLEDLGDNIVGLTNQVSLADLDPGTPGLEMVFAGHDGQVHVANAAGTLRWSTRYTSEATVLTGGFAIADLSGDGVPEIVFATYATVAGKAHLVVLHADGREAARVPLPGRGAMAVPTIADLEGDGPLEIVVNLKDGGPGGGALVFAVPGSAGNCLPWPTGRANLRRSGYLPPR